MRQKRLPFVERHGSGWRGWWPSPDGRKCKGPTRTTEHEAYEDARRARQRAERRGTELTIAQACEMVLDEARRQGRRDGTLDWYETQRKAVLRDMHGEAPLDSLTHDVIDAWLAKRQKGTATVPAVSAATCGHHLRFLRRMFRLAARHGWGGVDPLPRVRVPKAAVYRPDVFGWQEALDLIQRVRHWPPPGPGATVAHDLVQTAPHTATTSQRDADVFELLLRTGLRRAELARFRLEHFDARAKTLHVLGKTEPRDEPLSDEAAQCLQRLVDRGYGRSVFFSADGIGKYFRRWQMRLGERRWHAHALRHTLATELVNRGVALPTVARLIGHKGLALLMRYYGAVDPALRRAVAGM